MSKMIVAALRLPISACQTLCDLDYKPALSVLFHAFASAAGACIYFSEYHSYSGDIMPTYDEVVRLAHSGQAIDPQGAKHLAT